MQKYTRLEWFLRGDYLCKGLNVIFNGICEFNGFIFLLMSFVSKPVGLLRVY
jgi:hypothetical protein